MAEPRDVASLAKALGISDKQLARLRFKSRQDHGEKAEERLLARLRRAWEDVRDRPNLLGKQGGYTEFRTRMISASRRTEKGDYEEEPEAVLSDEIESYRASREAKQRHQAERMSEVGDLLSAMGELRAVLDAMPSARKRALSRTMWTLRSRLDSAERELRRRAAA